MLAAALLIALLGGGWAVRRHVRVPGHIRLPGGGRDAAYASAALKQIVGFAVPALLALAVLGRLGAVHTLPDALFVADLYRGTEDLIPALAIGALLGSLIGAFLARRRWRRSGRRGPLFGELGWLIPRNRRDLGWAAVLAVTAGVSEELYFRLVLPLLTTLATGSAVAGQTVAMIAFAAAHRYQGRAGVIATGAIGAVLTLLYLTSGSLWMTIAAHVLIDINSLVLIPAATGALRR